MAEPVYRQIADDLCQQIESGELGHGSQLPTELELRGRYEASRNTIRDAVKCLITRGLLGIRPGHGTFVVDKIDNPETGLGGGEGAAYGPEALAQSRTARSAAPPSGDPARGRVAVVEILRTAFDGQGRPFRLTVGVFPADRNEFVINVGAGPALRSRMRRAVQCTADISRRGYA